MKWEQGAYVYIPNNGSLPAFYPYMGMRYDPVTWLDDEDPEIMSIQANVDRINGLMGNQSSQAAFEALETANAIAAEIRSPAGDELARSAAAAYAAVMTNTPAAPAAIQAAQEQLADIATENPGLTAPAMAAVAALDRAAVALDPGPALEVVSLSATPPVLDSPLLITGAPTLPRPNLPPIYPTQPIQLVTTGTRNAGAAPPAGLPWWLLPVALFFLGRGSRL